MVVSKYLKIYEQILEYIRLSKTLQMNIWIYLYWGHGTNTNMNNIRGPSYSNIQIYLNICAHHCKYKSTKVQSTKVQKYRSTKEQKYKSTKVQKYKITWSRLIECDRGWLRLIKEGDWWGSSVIKGDWGWSRLIKGDQGWSRVIKIDWGWSRVILGFISQYSHSTQFLTR